MPFVRVWIHFVWSTKNREPYLTDGIRQPVLQHITENAKRKQIFLDCINGTSDHVHCLISLGSDQPLEKVMQLIKGESSFWINKSGLCRTQFAWQDEYFAVSVSESAVPQVRRYIANQGEHHRKRTFDEEFKGFMERAGFQKFTK